jgi:hypothetical protein
MGRLSWFPSTFGYNSPGRPMFLGGGDLSLQSRMIFREEGEVEKI